MAGRSRRGHLWLRRREPHGVHHLRAADDERQQAVSHHPLLGWEAGAEAGGSGYAGIPGYAADNGQELSFRQEGDVLWIEGLPRERPTELFPVISIECEERPQTNEWGVNRLWTGDPSRIADWARTRGTSVYVDGQPRTRKE